MMNKNEDCSLKIAVFISFEEKKKNTRYPWGFVQCWTGEDPFKGFRWILTIFAIFASSLSSLRTMHAFLWSFGIQNLFPSVPQDNIYLAIYTFMDIFWPLEGLVAAKVAKKMWKSQFCPCVKAFQGIWAVYWKKAHVDRNWPKNRVCSTQIEKIFWPPPRGPFELFKYRRNKLQTSRSAPTDLHNFCHDFFWKSCF